MKGDFTRFTFDPSKQYSRVLKQQGRVDLDADWNELNDILDHLDRTTRIDVIGECGVPIHHDGFEIALGGGGTDLTISAGRFYSHGILVELATATTYLTQPELPNPPALNPVDGRVDSVFLDVWERHITAIEDPEIREVALGGPDTCTRVHPVAQVRIRQNVGNATCENSPLPAPSGGRMLASVIPVPPSDDPCLIAPTGGYRGLENRLYRVEIHDPGNLGAATFKWSRDNGSVVFPVTEFPTGQPFKVRVSRLGRDQVLALRLGDWVEVLGDQSELAGTPGTLAEIVAIDEANRELTLSKDVSAHAAEDHPKVRRWDQPSDAIVVAAGPFVLEDGVQVEFSGSDFRTGDYWTFPARTATGLIDFPSTAQPPQGIEHFYCRLALVTWHVNANGVVTADITDCRKKFPPLTELPEGGCCCCTLTVGDGGDHPTLQAAVSAAAAIAGPVRICLLPGIHAINATVVINRSGVIIQGCGVNSRVVGGANPVVLVDGGTSVTFDQLWVESKSQISISARRVTGLTIRHSHFEAAGAPAALLLQGSFLRVIENTLRGAGVRITDGSESVLIRENDIASGGGAGVALGGIVPGIPLLDDRTGVVDVRILENRISAMDNSGISTVFAGENSDQAGDVEDVTIAGNQIAGCARQSPAAPFHPFAVGGVLLQRTRHVRIRENRIAENGAAGNVAACGVFAGACVGVEVDDNYIADNGGPATAAPPQCVNFSAMNEQVLANPFVNSGVRFEIFQFNGAPAADARIRSDGGFRGLGLNFRTVITLPAPASSVSVRLVRFSGPQKTVTALRDDGTAVATATTTGGQSVPETLVLNGAGIVRVEVSVPQDETNLLEFCFTPESAPVVQGGIIAFGVFGETFLDVPQDVAAPVAVTVFRGDPALAVRGNTVICPAGQSLLAVGIGPMIVEGNSLSSTGYRKFGGSDFPASVFVFNFGRSYHLAITPLSFTAMLTTNILGTPAPPDGVLKSPGGLDGRVLFDGNQVTFKSRAAPPPQFNTPHLFLTLDDISVENNQFVAEQATPILTNVMAWGFTSRMNGNRLMEIPGTAAFSGMTLGQQAMTSLNQATHCLFTFGVQTIEANNQVALTQLCPVLSRLLESVLRGAN